MFISREELETIKKSRDNAWSKVYELESQIEEAKPKVACANCHVLTNTIPSRNKKYCGSCQYAAQQHVLN